MQREAAVRSHIYNLEESCKDEVKGKQITLTGSRSDTETTSIVDNDAKKDKDALTTVRLQVR